MLEPDPADAARPARLRVAVEAASQNAGGVARIAAAVIAAVVAEIVVLAGPAPGELQGGLTNWLVLALAALILPGFAAMAILRPWWGLLGWLVLMPLLNISRARLETSPAAITASTVMIVALACGLLLAGPRPAEAATRVLIWARRGAIALTLLVLASAIASVNPQTSWPVAAHGALEPIALAALVVAMRPRVSELLQLGIAMGASVSIAAAYNIYRVGRFATSLADAQVHRVEFARFTYYNVNIFGEVLVIALPLLLAPIVLGRANGLSGRTRGVILIGFVISFLALYLTFSKGAWLGALAGVSLLFLLIAGTWLKRAFVVVVAALVAMLIVPYPLYFATALNLPPDNFIVQAYQGALGTLQGSDRLSSWDPSTSTGEVSVNERALAWSAAVDMAIHHPVLGVGPGRFGEELATEPAAAGMTRALGSAHNLLLNIAAEFGLLSLALVVAFLLGSLGVDLRAFRGLQPQARVVGLGLGCALAGHSVMANTTGADLYEPYRVMNSDVLFLALLIGAAIALAAVLPTVSAHGTPSGNGPTGPPVEAAPE